MRLLLKKCGCDFNGLARAPRSAWMRLFRSRRLYFCRHCKSRIFAYKLAVEGTAEWQATTMKLFVQNSPAVKAE